MKNLNLIKTENTPEVDFNKDSHFLKLSGESRPENVVEFYQPLLSWLGEYYNLLYYLTNENNSNKIAIKVVLDMNYFNSTSAKYILDCLVLIQKIDQIKNVEIDYYWMYNAKDEDMLENGQDYEEMTGIKFTYQPK